MDITKVTTQKSADYSLGDVIANLVFQLMMVLLLKYVADTFGMTEAICAALTYVIFIIFGGHNIIIYFYLHKPAIALITVFTYMALGIRCSTISYYFHDYVDQQALTVWLNQWGADVMRKDAYIVGLSTFMAFGAIGQILGTFLTLFINRRYKEQNVYIWCLIATALLTGLCYMPQPDDITLIYLLSLLKSVAYAPTIPLLWIITCKVADDVKMPSHRYETVFWFCGIRSAIKVGLGLGAVIAGLLLFSFSYTSVTYDALSWQTIQAIRWTSSIIPALLFAFSAGVLMVYPIAKSHDRSMLEYIDDIM